MEKERFDVVYHLAAYAAEGLSHFIRNYNYNNNLVATTNLITQSVRTGSVKKFVFTSSIAVYGSGRTPMTEDMEPLPEDPYGISKLACEYDLRAAHSMFGLDFVIFRPHNVYGPGQNMYDKYRNVVGIFLNQLQAGKNLTVFGDGRQTRKFSYISDVSFPIAVSGILPHIKNEVFNVGGDIATTVNELAEVTAEAWGGPAANVEHLDGRNEVLHAESDHKKLTCFFPGLPRPVGLRAGMRQMVEWAKKTGKYFKPVVFDAVEVKRDMPPSWVTPGMKEVPAFHHDVKDNILSGISDTPVVAKTEDGNVPFAGVTAGQVSPAADLTSHTESSLADLMKAAGTDKVWRHGYHRFYGTLLEPFRHKVGLKMLEIGVDSGQSMLPWIQFFTNIASDGIQGVAYKAVGEVATSECAKAKFLGCEKMKMFTGDQSDIGFLKQLIEKGAGLNPEAKSEAPDWDRGGWDLIIDDGSHLPVHQLVSFAALFPFVRPGGLYVIEDIESSYFDGTAPSIYDYPIKDAGLGKPPPGNFVEKMKQLIDVVNREWFYHPEFSILGPEVDHSIRSITFAGGLLWVQKNFASDAGYPNQLAFRDGEGKVWGHHSVSQWMDKIKAEKPFERI